METTERMCSESSLSGKGGISALSDSSSRNDVCSVLQKPQPTIEKAKTKASSCTKVAEHPITAVIFLSSYMVVYATRDHHVCFYDTTKSRLLYDVKLTHLVSTLDVWKEKYVLVGGSPVQLFEMKTNKLRRIVVIDPISNHQLMAESSYMGTFLASGHFATASEMGNEVVFWPSPTEEKTIITETATRLQIKSKQICSMWASGDSEQPLLAIAKKDYGQDFAVDVYDIRDYKHIKTVRQQPKFEKMCLTFEESGRKEIEMEYDSAITTTGKCQSPKVHIPVALHDGTIVLYEDRKSFTLESHEHSQISSLVCMESEGSTVVAAGYEDGKLGLWGATWEISLHGKRNAGKKKQGKFEVKPKVDIIEEIFTTQVFLGNSFCRESLLRDNFEFTVDFNGGKFENYPSYSLKIPRGAIPEGEKVVIRTGLMKYGPCSLIECPDDIHIVSPIVWFCSNKPKFQFLKPAVLELQHCANTPNALLLLKAGHDNMKKTHVSFKFQVQTSSNKPTSNEHYHSTEITHFCVYCYGKYSNNDGIQQGFRLIPVERMGYRHETHEVIMCLSYDLDYCQNAVKEQYPEEDYRIKKALTVKLKGDTEIIIEYPGGSNNGWSVCQKYPGHPIGLEDLNWEKRFPTPQKLLSSHRKKEYPPRFVLECSGKDAEKSVKIAISLTNVTRPVSYETELYMPSQQEESKEEMQTGPYSQGPADDSEDGNFDGPTFCRFPSNASPS